MYLGIKNVKRKAEPQKAELEGHADCGMKSKFQKGFRVEK